MLLWRRGTNVLTASNIMVTRDERVRLIDGYNLEISDLEPQDAGDYVCQISDKINRDQVHTVEILGEYNRPSVDRFCLRVKWTELASTSNLYEYFTYSIPSLSLSLSVPLTVPPSVRAIPTSGQLQARKGGPITLECKGSGNPVPSIYWTKKVCPSLSL